MIEILEIYTLLSLSCFITDNIMELYTRKRLKSEGYKFKKSKIPVFKAVIETLASLVLNFIPVLNIRRAMRILFKREEEFQRLKNGQIALGFIYKEPEIKKSEDPQDFGEIPPELKDVLERITATMNKNGIPVIIRAGFSGTLPENPEDFLDGIPHIVVGQVSFAHEAEEEIPFENMTVGEKIEFLIRQRETIIESTGYVIDENPSEKKDKEEEQEHQI